MLRGVVFDARTFVVATLAAAFVFSQAGCDSGPKGPDMHPVTGVVTMDGKPLDSATVFFRPSGSTGGNGSFGKTDADGRYALKTDGGGEGAVEGSYDVFVSREVGSDGKPVSAVVDPDAPAAVDGGIRESIPSAYSNYQRPTLNATVPAGGTTANFDLKSKP